MRAWLYDRLTADTDLQQDLGGVDGIKDRVIPRRSRGDILVPRPFLIFGLGNATDEQLGDSTANDAEAERQFFQIWVHDEEESYILIDNMITKVKKNLIGASSVPDKILTVRYLETSQEFNNETYNTNFRYIRFQAIRAKAGTPS
jgi:hypothetical protein